MADLSSRTSPPGWVTFPLGGLLALLFVEVLPENLLRGGVFEGPFYDPDTLTGVHYQAGPLMLSHLYSYRAAAEIGKDGFRTRLPLDRPALARIRVLILGPSLPFSSGCTEAEALHTRLESELKGRYALDAAIYNLALPNQPTAVSLSVLQRYAGTLSPTHIYYWGLGDNDPDRGVEYIARMRNGWNHRYYSAGWISFFGLEKSRLQEHSRLLRVFFSRDFWRNVSSAVLPSGLLAINKHLPDTSLKTEPATPALTNRQLLDIMTQSASMEGRVFIYSTGLPAPRYQFPHNGHMSPRGISLLAEHLAATISAYPSGSASIGFNPAGLLEGNLEGQP